MKNVVLISVDSNTTELEELLHSLDYNIVQKFIQKLKKPNPKYFIGSGFANRISEFVSTNDVELVVINQYLKASQLFNLEKIIKKTIFDRIRVILEVFTIRAGSEEARLQVELARLQYETPLVREWIHKAKSGEHPGFLAGGEYAVDQYYEMIRKRMKKIKEKLEKIRGERELRRSHRKRDGFFSASLIGYTNAGKSTLLNKLTSKDVIADEKMFSTLSTLTGRMAGAGVKLLFTDTVGFIEDLPPWLIEAFKSTLEEIMYSDVILLLVDVSNTFDEIARKLSTCYGILAEMENYPPVVVVLNKIDKINPIELDLIVKKLTAEKVISDYVTVSATIGTHLNQLIISVYRHLPDQKYIEVVLSTSTDNAQFINWLMTNTFVVHNEQASGDKFRIKLFTNIHNVGYISEKCTELNAELIQEP